MLDPTSHCHDRERCRCELTRSFALVALAAQTFNLTQEWTPYLRYGDHSWKRISDPLGRRDIGLLLAIQILAHDSDVFPVG